MISRAQKLRLAAAPDEWTDMERDWRAGIVFLRLEDKGLVEMRFRRTDYSDVSCGPGSHVSGVWQTRRTAAGRAALSGATLDSLVNVEIAREKQP